MADQLNMGALSLGDSQHANGGRSTYIPPHLRGLPQPPPGMDGPPLPAGGGINNSAWAANA